MAIPRVPPGLPDQLYLFDDGYSFGCRTVFSETVRFNAALLLSLDGKPFEVEVAPRCGAFTAAVMRPMLLRRLAVDGVALMSIGISPNHPDFRPFGLLGPPGLRALDIALFAPLAPELAALHAGELPPAQARQVYDRVVRIAADQLPAPRPLDPRVAAVMRRLTVDPDCPVEELAAEAGLSYDRMSHLFSENLGLSIRSYSLSLKIHAASRLNGSGRSLTAIAHQAGFTDSSHFSRVWQRAYGGSPSFFFDRDNVRLQTLYDAERPAGLPLD
jgi:AraC family transcriptional regulator of arabinose operon